ncbi:hypothetical protein Q8F55_001854 [Vanrija albida]|uniref:TNFR-Cys domain-containing protein n=1 Tax=Vanrija albida TaxID=181172 RepID=A0ABR3Q8Z5_9TREE
MRPSTTRPRLLLLALALLAFAATTRAALNSPGQYWCKCQCFTNSTIIPLLHPEEPNRPCLSCTRQFCLDQKLEICKGAKVPELDTDTGTGTEGDVAATCFKRDSPRDQVIVVCFVLICAALLLYAGVRARLRKAVEQRGSQPIDLREWGQALLPEPLHASVFGRGNNQRYAPVSVGS